MYRENFSDFGSPYEKVELTVSCGVGSWTNISAPPKGSKIWGTSGRHHVSADSAAMGATNSELEQLFEEKKRVRNPLVPLGAFLTAGVLTAGLISFRRGNSQLGQQLMRARVVAQGATVALMVGTAYYYGDKL